MEPERGFRSDLDQVLRLAGFDHVGKFEFTATETWSVEALTGLVYSTSFLNRDALGDGFAEFEHDLAELLRSLEPDGLFRASVGYAYDLARTPP